MGRIKRSWEEINFYSKQKDMQMFWIFAVIAVGLTVIQMFIFPRSLVTLNAFVFLVMATIIFISSFRLAKANFAVQTEKQHFQSIIVSLQDGVIFYDPNFQIQVFNQAAERIFSVSGQEIKGKEFTPAYAQQREWRRLAQVMFPSLAPVAVIRSEAGVFPQTTDISFEDPVLEVRVTTVKILDGMGKLLGFMKIVRDRTREIESARTKSEFVTVAAHQLRTPLNAIAWTFETLADEKVMPESMRQFIVNGREATAKALKTVNDLLDVTRIEEGQFGYQMQEVEFISFLENILAQKMTVAKQYGINIYYDRPQGEESINLKIDAKRLAIAVDNFLDNAIKYNVKNGEVIVKMERKKGEPFIQVSITDTGVGVPAEEVRNLFTKFFRGSNVLKFQTEGTGLGLYIAKNVIRQHGGQVWAESTLNRGSTFYFTLPTDPKLVPVKEVFGE